MIRTNTIQNGRRLELSFDRKDPEDIAALDLVVDSLKRSRYGSHQALLDQITRQCESIAPIVRFTLNPSAAARVEHALRFVFSQREKYPTSGHYQLHRVLCRALNVRLSTAQLVH
jgi:hypothetical protein